MTQTIVEKLKLSEKEDALLKRIFKFPSRKSVPSIYVEISREEMEYQLIASTADKKLRAQESVIKLIGWGRTITDDFANKMYAKKKFVYEKQKKEFNEKQKRLGKKPVDYLALRFDQAFGQRPVPYGWRK